MTSSLLQMRRSPGDEPGHRYDHRGLIASIGLRGTPIGRRTLEFYLGRPAVPPRDGWRDWQEGCSALSHIRYQFFGPADELLAA